MKFRSCLLAAAMIATTLPACAADQAIMDEIARLQHEWARIKYQTPDAKKQEEQMLSLAADSKAVAQRYAGHAEPLVWSGIITSSAAGLKGGIGALGMVSEARDMLEQAEKLDANALEGSVKTSLGSLYYQVPGFPVGFGSDKKARQYLESALTINPDGIDPNFFYGDFLFHQGEYDKAQKVLQHALAAPARVGREDADQGRRGEIEALLGEISKKLAKHKKS